MYAVAERYEQVARAVASRAADLLGVPVAVVDERAHLVAAGGETDPALLLASVRACEASVLRFPVELADRAGEVVVLPPAGGEAFPTRLARALVDLVVQQATTSPPRVPSHHALKNKFIYDLLRGTLRPEAELLREAEILGLDVTRPRAVLLIDAHAFIRPEAAADRTDAAALRRAQAIIASVVKFFSLPDDTICAYIGDGEVAVLKASSTRDLVAWTNGIEETDRVATSWANLPALKRAASALLARLCRDVSAPLSIGIGRCHPGLHGLRRSYQDARAALTLGRLVNGPNQVYCLDSLGVAAFVGLPDESTKRELAQHLLGPLDTEPELLRTLDVFFAENCCPSSTARQLWIHRNTLSYRLDKIAVLTGLDPRRFDDAVQIRLALVLRSLPPDSWATA
ncbi:MAG: helix-turn-helix domain-containing protein [Chloroflexi bacterium]|nr:helix-turn-helix domain-containing protein [Chloroflexota bacterium]